MLTAQMALLASAGLGGAPVRAATLTVQVQGRSGQPLADAVLMLDPLGAKPAPRPATPVDIAQDGRQFVPLVTVVPVGTAVNFPNRDRVQHHVYSFSAAKKFEIKLYFGKPATPIVFDQAGVVVLGCNIHDQMVGWVLVSDSAWSAKTGANGQASWADLPAGNYRLRSWHPDLPAGAPWPEQTLSLGAAPMAASVRLEAGLK
ncbi:methylamine utilization protein [Ideonella sp.]|uniref:methylamine utilization protein n=1 Tax=Ideonella sp. TaxID=1929293 RepID=UPI003BB5575A